MTDHLEKLLDQLEEPETPERNGVELGTATAWKLRGRCSSDAGQEEMEEEKPAKGSWLQESDRADGAENSRSEVRRHGPGDPLEKLLTQIGGLERSGGGAKGGTAMRLPSGTADPALMVWTAAPGDGVAALERRVAQSVGREPGTARTTERVVQVETGGGWMGLEELDRSVERDARRYDGGMRLY